MMPEWLFALVALILLSLLVAICVDERRREQRRMRERLGQVVKTPQRVKNPECPADVPEFCPLCARPMSWPIGAARVITLTGEEVVLVCSHCLALGALDSAMSAGLNHDEYPQGRTDRCPSCGPVSSDEAPSATLPGGVSPAAGNF